MKRIAFILFLIFWALASVSTTAEPYQCRKGNAVSRIEIIHERPKGELPCQVIFSPRHGEQQTLWRVQYERGLCARKAERKRDILEAEGWRCEPADEPKALRADTNCESQNTAQSALCLALNVGVAEAEASEGLERLLASMRPEQVAALSLVESASLARQGSSGAGIRRG